MIHGNLICIWKMFRIRISFASWIQLPKVFVSKKSIEYQQEPLILNLQKIYFLFPEGICFFGWSLFLFLFLFLRNSVSVAALELTRLPGLELGNDLLVSASWVPGLKMWHVMLSDLNFHIWEMRVWFPIGWKNPVLPVISQGSDWKLNVNQGHGFVHLKVMDTSILFQRWGRGDL